jgi:hypothetical protein
MMDDIKSGFIDCNLRRTDDIEQLLNSWWYRLGRVKLKALDFVDRFRSQFLRIRNIPHRFMNIVYQGKGR